MQAMQRPPASIPATHARVGVAFGTSAILVSLAAIGASIAIAPWFSWTGNTLSDLGRVGRTSAPIFNAGVTLGGILALGFAWYLWHRSETAFTRAGTGLFAVAAAGAILIGRFPSPHPFHVVASSAFYFAATYALLAYGTGDVRKGNHTGGVVAIWLVCLHATVWVGWLIVDAYNGLAVPELFGILMLMAWQLSIIWRDRHHWLADVL